MTATIASQLEPFFNEQLAQRLGAPVLALPRGAVTALPASVRVLVAAPMADGPAQAPAGWPFALDWIQLVSSGTDIYPPWFLAGLPVSTARGVAAESIAEYVIAALFDATKRLSELWVHDPAQWQTRPLRALRGSTLGLVGYGAIGQAIARKAQALGLAVLALRRDRSQPVAAGVRLVGSVQALLAQSDHAVLCAPATPQTQHLLNAQTLQAAKPGLHLVNVGRGELLDSEALRVALDDGRVALATLDTTAPEPLPRGHWLYHHPRVRLSPHTSAIGPETRLALVDKLLDNLARRAAGQPLRDLVAAPRS
jgi:phosphoglycerate dehydrogenase-like enzyme